MCRTLILSCLCACFVIESSGNQRSIDFEEAFHRVAKMNREPRRFSTRELEHLDSGKLKAATPFLEEVVKNGDPSAQDLAQNLLLKIRRPEEHAAWQKAVWVDSFRSERSREDGAIVVRWSDEAINQARVLEFSSLPKEVVISRDAGPVIRSCFREGHCSHALPLIPGCLDAAWAPAMIDSNFLSGDGQLLQLLSRIAKDAQLELREVLTAVHESPSLETKDTDALFRRRNLERNAAAVAEAFAMAGDDSVSEETGAALLQAIDHLTDSDALNRFCAAMGKLNVSGTDECLFRRAIATARDRDLHYMVTYASLRKHALQWMNRNGAKWLVEKGTDFVFPDSAMREGWLFELKNPGVADEMYLYWTDFYKSYNQLLGQKNTAEAGYNLFWNDGSLLPTGYRIPIALLTERATVLPPRDTTGDGMGWSHISELVRREDALMAFDVCARWFPNFTAIRALGELGDRRAFDVFRTLPDLPLERRVSFLLLAEAAMNLEGKQTVKYLEEIVAKGKEPPRGDPNDQNHIRWRDTADLAERLLSAARGDESALLAIMEGKEEDLRPMAARLLARRSHPKGIDWLVNLAIEAKGIQHENYRDFLITRGEITAKNLEARLLVTQDWRERLFAEAVLLRIREPETSRVFEREISTSTPWRNIVPPTLDQRLAITKNMVERAGKRSHLLFESAAAFQTDSKNALLALAAVGSDRELDSLIHMMPHLPPEKRDEVVFVLQKFGQKGIEAAKSVPPAAPQMAGFGHLRTAHLAATEARVTAGDKTSLESVLAGLATLPPPDFHSLKDDEWQQQHEWNTRTQVYLRHARAFRDPRLLEIGIGLIQKEHSALIVEAIKLVGDYEDPRFVPLCWDILSKKRKDNSLFPEDGEALDMLVAKLGKNLIPELTQRFASEPTSELREKWLHVFSKLNHLSSPHLGRQALTGLRKPLIQALKDPVTEIQFLAAELLATFSIRNSKKVENIDRVATEPLLAWSRQQQSVPHEVISYLEQDGHPDAGEVMMRLYMHDNSKSILASALATLRYEAALPEIVKAIEKKMLAKQHLSDGEFEAIHRFGAAGWKHLRRWAENREFHFPTRVRAALNLAKSPASGSRDVVVKLVDESIQSDEQVLELSGNDLGLAVQHALGTVAAHRLFTSKLLSTDKSKQQEWIAYWLKQWEAKNPKLKKIQR